MRANAILRAHQYVHQVLLVKCEVRYTARELAVSDGLDVVQHGKQPRKGIAPVRCLNAAPMLHNLPKLLIELNPERISTPWVAGSNPAGTAICLSSSRSRRNSGNRSSLSERKSPPANISTLAGLLPTQLTNHGSSGGRVKLVEGGGRKAVHERRRRSHLLSAAARESLVKQDLARGTYQGNLPGARRCRNSRLFRPRPLFQPH